MIEQPAPGRRTLDGVLALFCLPVGGACAFLGITAGVDPGGPRLLGIGLFFVGAWILLLGFQASGRALLPAGVSGMLVGNVLLLRIVFWLVLSFLLGVCGGVLLLFLVAYAIA